MKKRGDEMAIIIEKSKYTGIMSLMLPGNVLKLNDVKYPEELSRILNREIKDENSDVQDKVDNL